VVFCLVGMMCQFEHGGEATQVHIPKVSGVMWLFCSLFINGFSSTY